MSDNEKKEINADEQVSDVSSLINLCAREENLPALQLIGMKQRVAFRFERMLHSYMYNCGSATAKFATYITLLETKPNVYGNVCDILSEFVSEEVIEECLMYIRSGIVPYHVWTDKLLDDIKGSAFYNKESIAGMLTVYLGKTLRASLIAYHKAVKALEEESDKLPEDVMAGIEFIKTRYMEIPQDVREEYMNAFNTEDEEMRRKFADNETSIFTETLVDMLSKPISQEALEAAERGELGPYDIFWVEPPFGGATPLVSNARGEGGVATSIPPQQTQGQQDPNQPQTSMTPPGMGSWLKVIGRGPKGETAEEMERMAELENNRGIEFHWDNPDFREFIERYFLDEEDFYKRELPEEGMLDTYFDETENGEGIPFSDLEAEEIMNEAHEWHAKARAAYLEWRNAQLEDATGKSNFLDRVKREINELREKNAPKHKIENVATQYKVEKICKDSSKRVMSTNWFDTEDEAEEFVRELEENNPMMMRSFDFKITPGVRP